MQKEHSGGSPSYGLDEDWRDESSAVKINHAAFSVETFKGELQDRIKSGDDIEQWVAGIIRGAVVRATTETVRRIAALLADSRKPRLKLHQVLWAFGFNALLQGADASQLAKRNGVSKQDFQQGADRIRLQFDLPVTQAMRDLAARDSMSKHNHRKEPK